jgi:hypothetical protein
MASITGHKRSLEITNQFKIVCPVFRAETKIAACVTLHELYMRGEGPPTRRGCQVAMAAGKCPISAMIREIFAKQIDPYHSVTAKVGKLSDTVLARIAPVLVHEKAIERAGLPPAEAAMLFKANDEARDGVKRAVKKARRADPTPAQMDELVASEKDSGAMSAAVSGDMAAAINEEIKAS